MLNSSITLYKEQQLAFNEMKQGKNLFLTGVAGSGKCLAKNTTILMYDGQIKKVQDIKYNDKIMGDESTPRTILSTTRGYDKMFKITTDRNDSYIVNKDHILTFKSIHSISYKNKMYILKWGSVKGDIRTTVFKSINQLLDFKKNLPLLLDIPILDCIKKQVQFNPFFKGVYTSIYFNYQPITIHPYYLGYKLGTINSDQQYKVLMKIYECTGYNKKNYIPLHYKCNLTCIRLLLLAGIIDSIGKVVNDTYSIHHQNVLFLTDILFMSKSVGFHSFLQVDTVIIKGNVSIIPVVKNKVVCKNTYNNMTTSISIQYVGYDDYYGFEIDKNHRFVLGTFILTHNTSCIKHFIECYKHRKSIGITSTTAISAILFGGKTLHSYLGIGLGTGTVENLSKKIIGNKYIKKRWLKLDVLIIDEISMLSPELFDKLESIACIVRGNDKPFGGIQLILSGDFLQLPCIQSDTFCFQSKSWLKCISTTIYLTFIIRQTDVTFQTLLNHIRIGMITDQDKNLLLTRLHVNLQTSFGIQPTKLCCTNYEVDLINKVEVDKLGTEDTDYYEYHLKTTKVQENISIDNYQKYCPVADSIQLCVGVQVMLIYNMNIEKELINGSRGVVIGFVHDFPLVKFLNGQEMVIGYHIWDIEENNVVVLQFSQVPLKIAYALSIHKSQGCTLDLVELNLTNLFEHGQGYVALSRVKSLDSISITSINFEKIVAHPLALDFYQQLIKNQETV